MTCAIHCLYQNTVCNMELSFQFMVCSSLFVLLTKRYSADQVAKDEMGGACGTYGENRNRHRAIVNKTQLKGLLVRPRRRGEDNSNVEMMVRTDGTD
jgi:hypothetical protein